MKKALFNLLLTVLLLIVTIGLAEVALRIVGTYYTPQEIWEDVFVDSYSSQINSWYHVRMPNDTQTIITNEFEYTVTTNSEGIIDKEQPITKAENEYRILTLGDSFTEGFGVPQFESWPHHLQQLLNEDSNYSNITVIQGGVAGSDPFCSYVLLRDKLLKYQPDLVIQATNHSDLGDAIVFGGLNRFLPDTTVAPVNRPLLGEAYKKAHVVRWLFNTILSSNYTWLYLSNQQHRAAEEKITVEYGNLYQQYQLLANKHNFKLVVLIHPIPQEADSMEYHVPVKQLINKIEENDIAIIYAIDYFNKQIEKGKAHQYYWPEDGHHNKKGYQLIAGAVMEWFNDYNNKLDK